MFLVIESLATHLGFEGGEMSTNTIKVFVLGSSLGLAIATPIARAVPTPDISISTVTSGSLILDVSNVATGSTYYIEHIDKLTTTNWQEIDAFEGSAGNTSWNAQATNSSAFFRVIADPYQAKVGESATFTNRYHNVNGTAHIVNNRTIELDNFYFDGGGIDVRVIVSPNLSFSSYTVISEDLVGTVFSNDTLTLRLPDSVNLDNVSYISVYCVDVNISFGDGMFQ